jgi:ADP-heptose:LPS heptosyltransferase
VTRRVLVARLDSVGDVLLAGPAVRAIAAHPDVEEVRMLCSSSGAAAARLLPGVDGVLTWECPWIVEPAPPVSEAVIEQLRALIVDFAPTEAVLLTSFHQSPLPLALVLRLLGVERITGASVDHAGSLLDVRLTPGENLAEDVPETQRALAIARAAGFPGEEGDDRLAVRDLPTAPEVAGDTPYVVVHPGATAPSRTWPAARHASAVEALAEAGFRVLVTGSPSERELTRRVAGSVGVDLGGRLDLAELAAVLRDASVLVSGNTGPAHLAAAVGTPVVSLFSPVVPAVRWAPYGVPVVLLGDQTAACRDSRARDCPIPGHPCLESVRTEQVVEACVELSNAREWRRSA